MSDDAVKKDDTNGADDDDDDYGCGAGCGCLLVLVGAFALIPVVRYFFMWMRWWWFT